MKNRAFARQNEKTQIRSLKGQENLALREVWEEVFWEDSKEFTDYYFKEKAARNQGLALCGSEGIRAMLFLSPYQMQLRVGEDWECREVNYIVGVATREEYRHRGYMNRLLKEALELIHGKHQPFVFLMPANPRIYEPYQFTYVYDRTEYEILHTAEPQIQFMDEGEIPRLREFACRRLAENYDVFIRRDEEYYQVLMKELEAQGGGISICKSQGEIVGYFLYTKEEQETVQEAEGLEGKELPFKKKEEKKPVIMARITDVKQMLSMLRTAEGTIEVLFAVEDALLEANSGVWRCIWSKERALIQKTRKGSAKALAVTIDALTAWVFGYKGAEECFAADRVSEAEDSLRCLGEVQTLKRVFINEIV